MSDFLQKFKSIFVVEDPATAANNPSDSAIKPADVAAPAVATSSQSTSSAAPVSPSVGSAGGRMSDKFVEILSKAIEDNNQEGFDFFEFRGSLKSLAKMPMDDQTRFQSAFAMAATMGATPQKLVASAQFYLDVLKKEEQKFGEAAELQRAKLVGSREEEMRQLDATWRNKAEQIKDLTRQIEEHQARIEKLKDEIADATEKVEATAADFSATYQVVVGQIQEDVGKMQAFLK